MDEKIPGWELYDDTERVSAAKMYAIQNGDQNGYFSSRDLAVESLEKMEEPFTDDEIDRLSEKTRLVRNASDPNTPDNVETRQAANESYYKTMASAIISRNNQIRATGVALPGDTRRNDGSILGPDNELQAVIMKLKSGVPPESLNSI